MRRKLVVLLVVPLFLVSGCPNSTHRYVVGKVVVGKSYFIDCATGKTIRRNNQNVAEIQRYSVSKDKWDTIKDGDPC